MMFELTMLDLLAALVAAMGLFVGLTGATGTVIVYPDGKKESYICRDKQVNMLRMKISLGAALLLVIVARVATNS